MLGRKKQPAEFLRDLEDGQHPVPSSSYKGLMQAQDNSSRLKAKTGSGSESSSLSLFRRQNQYDELLDDADSSSPRGNVNGISEAALRSGGETSSSGDFLPRRSSSAAPDGLLSRLTLKGGKAATMMPMSFSRVGGLSQGASPEPASAENTPRRTIPPPPPTKLGSFSRKGSSSGGKAGGALPPVSKGPTSGGKAASSGGKAATKRSRMASTDANYDSTSFEELVDEDQESPPEKGTIPLRSAGTSPFQFQDGGSNPMTPSRTPDHATPIARSSPSLMSQAAKLAASLQGSGRMLLTKRRSGEALLIADDSALESGTQLECGEEAHRLGSDCPPISAQARLTGARDAGRQARPGILASPGSRQPLLEDSLAYSQSPSPSPSPSPPPAPSFDNRLPGSFPLLTVPLQHYPPPAQYPPSLPVADQDPGGQNEHASNATSTSQRSLGGAAALDSVSSFACQATAFPPLRPAQGGSQDHAPASLFTGPIPQARQSGRAGSARNLGSSSALDSVSSFRSGSSRSLENGEYRASDPGSARQGNLDARSLSMRRHSEGLLRPNGEPKECPSLGRWSQAPAASEPEGEPYDIFEPRADAGVSVPADAVAGFKSGSVLQSLTDVKNMKARDVLQALHRGAHLRKKWVNGTTCSDAAQANKTLRLIRCRTEGDKVLLFYKPQGMKGLMDKEEVSAIVQRVEVPDGAWKQGDCILVFTSCGPLALEAPDTATHATWVFGLNAALSSCQARRKDVLLEAAVHTIPRNPMFVVAPATRGS